MRAAAVRFAVAAVLGFSIAAVPPAPAEDAKPPAVAAKDLYDKASKLFKEKKFEDALAAYRELLDKHASQTAVSSKKKEIAERIDECETQVGVVKRASQVFKGKAQLVGKNVLKLSYDFSDEAQLEDFDHYSAEGKVVDGELELGNSMPRSYFFWNLKDAVFEDNVVVDMQVSLPPLSEAEICVSAFFTQETWSGYRFCLHYDDGDAFGGKSRFINVIRKEAQKTERDWDKTFNLGTASKPMIEPEKKYRWKIQARQGNFQMLLNNAPLITKQDKSFRKGKLRFGGAGGPVRFDDIHIEGQVNPEWLRKAFSEAETVVQRGKMKDDLGEKDGPRLVVVVPLSVESKETLATVDKAAVKAYDEGQKYHMFWNFDKAIDLYTTALKTAPDFAAARLRRAQCYAHRGDEDRALQDLTAAIDRHPDFHEAYKERGDVLLGRSSFDEALSDYNKAIEARHDYGAALASRAYLFFAQGDRDKALKEIEAAAQGSPDDPEIKKVLRNLRRVVAGPPWRKDKTFVKETDHYVVKSDISAPAAALYAQHLEAIYKLYTEKFSYKVEQKEKARAYVFDTREGYMTYAELSTDDRPEFTLGYYHPHYRELLLFEDLDKAETLRVLYHEGFHQFLHNLLPRPPYWFNEGVAEYFGASRVEGGRVAATGLIQEGRLSNIKMFLEMRTTQRLAEIINATPAQFYGGGPSEISARYAQAWSMIHFFFNYENGRYFPLLRDYYKALRDGRSQKEAFDATFAKANLIAMEKEWKEYVKKLEPPKK